MPTNKKNMKGGNTSRKVTSMSNLANRQVVNRIAQPKVVSTPSGLIIRNQETWSTPIQSAQAVNTVVAVGLNPADPGMFPWLSPQLRCYGKYRWNKLRVCYQASCSTTVNGDITMGLFYDREDLNSWFGNSPTQGSLSQTIGSSCGPIWGSTVLSNDKGTTSEIMVEVDVTRAHLRTPWFVVDPITVGSAGDNQAVTAFLGLFISQNGIANSLFVGRLWFDYEIEMLHPTPFLANPIALVMSSPYNPGKDIKYVKGDDPNTGYPPIPKEVVGEARESKESQD